MASPACSATRRRTTTRSTASPISTPGRTPRATPPSRRNSPPCWRPFAPDGDLLIYGRDGAALRRDSKSLQAFLAFAKAFAPDLQEITIRRDLAKEKREDFESTTTYRELRKVLRARSGRTAAYARVPQITLSSPKLSRDRTTHRFARAVDRRYDRCLAAARSLAARDTG